VRGGWSGNRLSGCGRRVVAFSERGRGGKRASPSMFLAQSRLRMRDGRFTSAMQVWNLHQASPPDCLFSASMTSIPTGGGDTGCRAAAPSTSATTRTVFGVIARGRGHSGPGGTWGLRSEIPDRRPSAAHRWFEGLGAQYLRTARNCLNYALVPETLEFFKVPRGEEPSMIAIHADRQD